MMHTTNVLSVKDCPIRMYDRLLLVVGNHGAGKTQFLLELSNHQYQLHSDVAYQPLCCLIHHSTDTVQWVLNQVFNDETQWEKEYQKFLYTHFDQEEVSWILQKAGTVSDFLDTSIVQNLPIQRWILMRMLLEITNLQPLMIIMDEPELFAHPQLVREFCVLLNQLRQQGHMIIVATNSETVVADLFEDIEQVVRLEKGKMIQANAQEIEQKIWKFYHQDTMLERRFSEAKQVDVGLNNVLENYIRIYLSSVFRNSMFTMMHSDYVLLGEGSSEDILFDYIDQILHPEWVRKYRVKYTGCLGKSTMPFYFIFLNALGIGTVCIHDYDNDTNPVHVAYAKAFQTYEKENPSLFKRLILNPDLEHVLQICPDYKLLPMEKPINVFQETFVTNHVKDKVEELTNLMKIMIEEMKDEEMHARID